MTVNVTKYHFLVLRRKTYVCFICMIKIYLNLKVYLENHPIDIENTRVLLYVDLRMVLSSVDTSI
jgi:hypothetical protein